MKTQKISIFGKYPTIEWKEVPATIVNISPRWTCFVHKHTTIGLPNAWAVSEKSTGANITTGRTRKEAIAKAESKIREVGDVGMEIAISAYHDRIKEYDVKCPVCNKSFVKGTCIDCDKLVASL